MDEFINVGVIISKDALKSLDDDSNDDNEAKSKLFDSELRAHLAAWSEDEVRNMLVKLIYENPIVKKALLKDLAAPQVQVKVKRVVRARNLYSVTHYSLSVYSQTRDTSKDNIGEYNPCTVPAGGISGGPS